MSGRGVDHVDAARAAREAQRKGPGASPALRSTNKSVTVQSTDGKTTVTITETGPDGKSVSRTYEGSDLESIRRELKARPGVWSTIAKGIRGVSEETTTGVHRLYEMMNAGTDPAPRPAV